MEIFRYSMGTMRARNTQGLAIGAPPIFASGSIVTPGGAGGTGVPTVGRTVLVTPQNLVYLRETQISDQLSDADKVYIRGTQDGDLP